MSALPLDPDDPRELGRFRIIGRLGEGGQGVVYLGEDGSGAQVAVKVLKTGADERARERLAREMAAAQQVAPFCTARVIEASVRGPRPYVVSEFVDGPSLLKRVSGGGPLRAGDLDRLVVGTATALTAIHGAGVIHRDLKPANVMLGPDGPRVVDFGIARAVDSSTTTGLVGTPAYFAPEQLGGAQPTPACDLFSWAATMVFAATGNAPFGQDTIPAVLNRIAHHQPDLRGVPEHLLAVLAECLEKDPARRPTARDLLVRLVDPSAGVERHVGGQLAQAAGQALNAPPDRTMINQQNVPPAMPPTAAGSATSPLRFGQPTGPIQRRRGRAGLAAAVLGGVLVVGLAVGLGTAWLLSALHTGTSGSTGSTSTTTGTTAGPAQGGAGASADTGSTDPSTVPSTNPGSGPVIPADLAGTWTGKVSQTHNLLGDTLTSDVRLTMKAGQRTAPALYSTWGCTETRTLTAIHGSDLIFGEATTTDPINCSTYGTLTLTRNGGTLKYHWGTGPSGEMADAILHRS